MSSQSYCPSPSGMISASTGESPEGIFTPPRIAKGTPTPRYRSGATRNQTFVSPRPLVERSPAASVYSRSLKDPRSQRSQLGSSPKAAVTKTAAETA